MDIQKIMNKLNEKDIPIDKVFVKVHMIKPPAPVLDPLTVKYNRPIMIPASRPDEDFGWTGALAVTLAILGAWKFIELLCLAGTTLIAFLQQL